MGRTNVLLLTVDDMNYDSAGVFGCKTPDITPNIDALAAQGLTFENAHVAIAVCQPSRSALMTGRYPHRNGARGFEEIDRSVTTLTEALRCAGYYNGIIGKEDHLTPRDKFAWDAYISTYNEENDFGRSPARCYEHTRAFLRDAQREGRPFFLMANSHDPHRPFAGSDEELAFFGRHTAADREYDPGEIDLPGFLPDLPKVRREVAQYYTSVRRADQAVGEILRALEDAGHRDDTLVLFLSDNGMAFPFAKTNCYLNSTKSPWILRWPGHASPGAVTGALVSGIDFAPTVLEALGLETIPGMDGISLLPVIEGERSEHYDTVYTQFFKTARNHITQRERHYPMRCVQDKRYAYIYNAWSDGETVFVNESMSGMTFAAMQEAAAKDPAVAGRVALCQYRTKEELFDYRRDPDALENLIDSPEHAQLAQTLREKMREYMERSQDELLPRFLKHLAEKDGEP